MDEFRRLGVGCADADPCAGSTLHADMIEQRFGHFLKRDLFVPAVAGFLTGENANLSGTYNHGECCRPVAAVIFHFMGGAAQSHAVCHGRASVTANRRVENLDDQDAIGIALQTHTSSKIFQLVAVTDFSGQKNGGKLLPVHGKFALMLPLMLTHEAESFPGICDVAGKKFQNADHVGDLFLRDDWHLEIGRFEADQVNVGVVLEGFLDAFKAFPRRWMRQDLPGKEGSEILTIADDGNGDVRQSDVASVDLGATRGAAALLRGQVGMGAGFFLMRAEAMDKITKQGAGRGAISCGCASRLQLNQGVFRANAILELALHRIDFLVPDELDVTNGPGIIEEQQEMFEEL